MWPSFFGIIASCKTFATISSFHYGQYIGKRECGLVDVEQTKARPFFLQKPTTLLYCWMHGWMKSLASKMVVVDRKLHEVGTYKVLYRTPKKFYWLSGRFSSSTSRYFRTYVRSGSCIKKLLQHPTLTDCYAVREVLLLLEMRTWVTNNFIC